LTDAAAAGTSSLLAVTGGHRVELPDFFAMVGAVAVELGWTWAHTMQPGAQVWLDDRGPHRWSAILLHDLPGLTLTRGAEPAPFGPSAEVRHALVGLLASGQGLVVTHHALAGWPAWDGWARAIGGRFLYAPASLFGVPWPASGYRMDRHHVDVVAPDHPVCAGVEGFDVDDELYLCPVLTDEVVPLLATTASLDGRRFRDSYEEVRYGRDVDCRDHPPGSPLIGWVTVAERSPVVYLQPGHGPETMRHPMYRRLLRNALAWVASPDAHAWASTHPRPLD
jgi:uncharacterized protein